MQITDPRRFALAVIIILGIPLVTFFLGWKYFLADLPLAKSGEFVVAEGMGAAAVWEALVEQKYTPRTTPWRYRAWRADAAAHLQAGTYVLNKDERISEIIGRLMTGDTAADEFTITYPEGFTLEQMAERTASRGIGTAADFIAAAAPDFFAASHPFLAALPSGRSLEGYLFPDTYQVFADDAPRDVIARMLSTFNRKVIGSGLVDKTGHSLDELVIMASIVEREVLSDDDMARVAGVLWRREQDGVGLDADATVRYALKKWQDELSAQDLKSDSPYNTRRWQGLPPGPISNPGLRAIAAAANPEKSDFYYYLSAPNGETIFSRTNAEHNENKIKYLH